MRRFFLLLLLVLCFESYSQSGPMIKKDIETIPINVRSIERYPINENGTFSCFVRLIFLEYGWEHISSPLVIQWIFDDQEKRELFIKYNRTVEEIAMLSNSVVSIEMQKDSLHVLLIGRDTADWEESKYLLIIKPNGTYKIEGLTK